MIKKRDIAMLDDYHYRIRNYLGIKDKEDIPEVDEVIIEGRKRYTCTEDILEYCKCVLQIGINGHGYGEHSVQ